MKMPNQKTAEDTAQANADYFGVPYAVFEDSNGNIRVERYFASATYRRTVFQPKQVNKAAQAEGKKL